MTSISLPAFDQPLARSVRHFAALDGTLMLLTGVLAAIGVLMISSASMEIAEARYNNPFYHLLRQLLHCGLAVGAGLAVTLVPIRVWQKMGWLFMLAAFVLLGLVLMPGIGKEVNGSMRWIRLAGFNLQASEFAKLFLLIYLADYLARRLSEVRSQWSGFLKPLCILALVILLLLLEPDFGAVVVLLSAALGMMFLGGVKLGQFIVLIAMSLASIALMAVSQPYRMQRLTTFADPWSAENVYGSGYQLTQALIAFGRGEWFGVGLGNSVQKLFYLPEAHTDFVFAILAEELGLIGVMLVLALFLTLVVRIMLVGRKAERNNQFFAAYLVYGIGIMLAMQALINFGVNTGLLPTKGLTLPLLSYGGSSLIATMIAIALVLRVNSELDEPDSSGSDAKGKARLKARTRAKP